VNWAFKLGKVGMIVHQCMNLAMNAIIYSWIVAKEQLVIHLLLLFLFRVNYSKFNHKMTNVAIQTFAHMVKYAKIPNQVQFVDVQRVSRKTLDLINASVGYF
jgi:L-cystine uptake protein TcyP (sodium:dicarboxylate symporter family)